MRILFFGKLGERFGPQRDLAVEPGMTIASIVEKICEREPDASDVLLSNSVIFVLNNEIARADTSIDQAEELAFLPPVSGG